MPLRSLSRGLACDYSLGSGCLKEMGLRFMLAVASQRITARRAQLASASRSQRKRLSLRTCFGRSGSLAPLWCCQATQGVFSGFSFFCRATQLPKYWFSDRASL